MTSSEPTFQEAVKSIDSLPDDTAILGDYPWVKVNSDLIQDSLAAEVVDTVDHSVWWDEAGVPHSAVYVADEEGSAENCTILRYHGKNPSKSEIDDLMHQGIPFIIQDILACTCRDCTYLGNFDGEDKEDFIRDMHDFIDESEGLFLYR